MIPVTRIRLPSSSPAMSVLNVLVCWLESVAHAHTAVDGDHRAGDVTGVLGGQEADGPGHLRGGADPLGRDELQCARLDPLVQRAGHLGVDVTGCDDVGGHTRLGQFAGDRAGHPDQARLGGRVVGLVADAPHAGHRADVDDAAEPLFLHAPGRALGHPERPGQVGVDDLGEPLLRHPDQECVLGDTGVGHQHLDRPLVLLHLCEGAVDGVVVGDVALDTEQPVGRPGSAVRDGHLVGLGGQPLGDRQTDAPVSSGHQDGAGDECRSAVVGGTFGGVLGGRVSHPVNLSPRLIGPETGWPRS
uniref:MAV301 n=1 Tax=Mycobacterium avium TaxID=1764 RepID=O07398_MYCAV|nr:MAV301 [Mycobacterium avium]